jgi:hypothetical protein
MEEEKNKTDYTSKTYKELLAICREYKLKGYSKKKREELIDILNSYFKVNKKNKGQFYTTNSSYILDGLSKPPSDVRAIVEPFAGKGDLIDWVERSGCKLPIEAYDIEPKNPNVIKRDTLLDPPNYDNSWIITNPPYLARNKSKNKEIYDLYETNDLYKCFILSVLKQNNCRGGIFIIPAGFFFSPRDIDVRCRHDFMTRYRITKMKYFEQSVFDDTTTTVVAFSFERADEDVNEQDVEWEILPSKEKKTFKMSATNNWIIGGEIYNLPIPDSISIRRHVEGQKMKENEQQTYITLNALDSGRKDGRICLEYKKNYIYPAKDCSRTYATFRIVGKTLSEKEQMELCSQFNEFLEEKRGEYWSLFLPQFRESKEYARKRIPFELAYNILLHIIGRQLSS